MISAEVLKKYLRRNPPSKKKGVKGSFYIRFLFRPSNILKAKRKNIGLATNDLQEALNRARVLLRGCYALGAEFTSHIKIVPKKRKKKVVALPDLWDWAASLHPKEEVEKENKTL